MKSRLKKVAFGIGCLVVGSVHPMNSSLSMRKVAQIRVAKIVKSRALQERQVAEYTIYVNWINKQDSNGCTHMHRCMLRKGATVKEIKSLIERGGRLDIKNKDGEDPYHYGLICDGNVKMWMPDKVDRSRFYNIKVINFVHSEMLRAKLLMLANNEYPQEGTAKKSSIYKIT
jgi:hypothetical protein